MVATANRTQFTLWEHRRCASHPACSGRADQLVRSTVGERLDRHGRMIAAARYEAATVDDVEVRDIMCSMVPVDDRSAGIITHPTGPAAVSAAARVRYRVSPHRAGARGLKNFQAALAKELHTL